MDVESAIALAAVAAGSAATEAGRHAWESLVTLSRRLRGRAVPEPVDPGDDATVRVLTGRIADHARSDPNFAAELCRWAETHRAAIQYDYSQVHNTLSDQTRVDGAVIQARDIHGGMTFGL